jgi:protocatechuate 3,4-dioxygenase beta subunit
MKTLVLMLAGLPLFYTSAPPQVPKSPAQAKAEECKISGMVVKLADSEPLRKARALLQSVDDQSHRFSVTTDAGGHFELKGVEPGRYKLLVSRSGFVTQEYGQRRPDDPGSILTLRPGQEVKDLLFRLIPSAIIAGRILDEDGEPLASVIVSALREVYSEGKRSLATSSAVSTDDLGQYRLFGLPPGRYFVSAVYPHWGRFGGNGDESESSDQSEPQQQGYAKMFYPGTPDPSKAIPIKLKSGEETSSIEVLMRQVVVYHVRGHIFNQITHKSNENTVVMLMPKKTGRQWEFSDQQTNVQKKDGSFDIPEVLPGSYILTGFWFDEGKSYSTRVPIEVGSADVDGVAVNIAPGVNVSGRISWDGPAALENNDLTVNARPAESGWNFWGNGTRVTQASSFTLKDVGEGRYFAEVAGQSKDCYVQDVQYAGSSVLDDGFTVARGSPGSLEITISSRGARVQGSVVDTEGLPASGVWVVLVPDTEHRAQSRRYKTATTDQYGRFDLRGIAPGDYKIFSWEQVENGSWEDPEFLKPFEEKGEAISFQKGEQKTVNLTAIRTKAPDDEKH